VSVRERVAEQPLGAGGHDVAALDHKLAATLRLVETSSTRTARQRSGGISGPALNPVQRVAKRALDLCAATALLILLAPMLAVFALLIRLDSAGPALFRQRRLGLHGRPFDIVKFRTMTVLEDGDDIVQVSKDDPRVTRIGRWLRRSSLDELPQLVNVIKGDMSLVGPRPHAVVHDQLFDSLIENYKIRQLVKPGITGWAQVHGFRGETRTAEAMRGRVRFDVWYVRNVNVLLDLRILLLTPGEVLRQRNAH
jgi:putative colanic acid biosynthesis UDP-glucose lipid carrier transferase